MKSFFAILFILTLGAGCSDGGVETISKPVSSEVNLLLSDIEALERGLSSDLILSASTKEEALLIKDYLLLVKVLSLRLNSTPSDHVAVTELFKTLKKIENFPFSERDAGLFERMIHRLRVTLNKFAVFQGLSLEGLEWSLYSFKFTSSLASFKELKYFTASPNWAFGRGGGNSFSKVGSRGVLADAWLFSPTLDLTNSKKQTLVIEHTVKNPEWKNLKVLVSKDYRGLDPTESTWVEVKIKPEGDVQRNQWINLKSPVIDLSQFSGSKITIAFRFLATKESSSVWQILGLNIKGTGDSITSSELEITYTPIEEANE